MSPEDFKDRPKRPKKRATSRAASTNQLVPAHPQRGTPEMLSLPKNWFLLEYYKELRKVVRGPISKSRRRCDC